MAGGAVELYSLIESRLLPLLIPLAVGLGEPPEREDRLLAPHLPQPLGHVERVAEPDRSWVFGTLPPEDLELRVMGTVAVEASDARDNRRIQAIVSVEGIVTPR